MTTEKEISVQELEKEIIAFLDTKSTKSGGKRLQPGCNLKHGSACALGTCVDNKPRVTPVDFFNEGLTLWIAGEPGGKIANIKRNPNVSVGIYEPADHTREHKSLQLWGTAELINIKNDPDCFKQKVAIFGLNEALMGILEELVQKGKIPAGQEQASYEKIIQRFNFIKITPQKITLLHMCPGKPTLKKTWEPEKATCKVAGV